MSFTPIAIKSAEPSKANYRTFMCYGDTRTGKTRFAGTFPNALFIADKSERGWTTLETMPEDEFYHPGKPPLVFGVINRQEMTEALAKAEQLVKLGYIDTLVVDSLTFYAESWYQSELQATLAVPNAKLDTRAMYGALSSHLADIRMQIHEWGCNVVWTALASPPEDGRLGGPMISGKSRERFPAGCDHIFRHYRWESTDEETKQPVVGYSARTAPHDNYVGGGRDSGAIPDPFNWPTFKWVAHYLNLPEFEPKYVPEDVLTAPVAPPAPVNVGKSAPPKPVTRKVAVAKGPPAKPPAVK